MKLKSDGYAKVGDCIYFSSADVNCIYSLNLISGETKLVGYIPEEASYKGRLSAKILCEDNKLYFIPYHAKKLWIFDLIESAWSGIDILPENQRNNEMKFYEAFFFKKKLYMIGCFIPMFVVLDLNNNDIEYIDNAYLHLLERQREIKDCFYRAQYVIKDDSLYLASCLSNEIVIFNLLTRTVIVKVVGNKNNRYSGMAYDGKYFWISPRVNTNIVKWDGLDSFEEYEFPQSENSKKGWMQGVVIYGDRKIFPGISGKHTIVIDNTAIKVVEEEYWMVDKGENAFIIYHKPDGRIIIEKDGIQKEYNTVYSRKKLDSFLQLNVEGMKIYYQSIAAEKRNVGLKEFIKFICK